MKKFISMVMAAAMVVSLVPATAFAKGEVKATAKVVDALEETKDFDGKVDGVDDEVPELQLRVTSTDYLKTESAAKPELKVTVTLDNADFANVKAEDIVGVRLDSTKAGDTTAVKKDMDDAKDALDAAKAAATVSNAIKGRLDLAKADVTTKGGAVTTAETNLNDAKTAVTTAETALKTAQDTYYAAYAANPTDTNLPTLKQAVTDAETALKTAQAAVPVAETALQDAKDDLDAAKAEQVAAQAAFDDAVKNDANVVKAQAAYDDAVAKYNAAVNAASKADASIKTGSAKFTDDNELEFVVEGELAKDDIIYVDLYSVMDKTSEGRKATVSVECDAVDADDLVYVSILGHGISASVKSVANVAEEEKTTLAKDLKIKSAVGDFATGQQFELKLSKGFEFTKDCKGGTGYSFSDLDDNKITLTWNGAPTDEITVDADDVEIEAVSAKSGSTATLTVKSLYDKNETGTFAATATVEVMKVVDYKVVLSVDEDEDVPVIYSGVDVDNTGITDDSDHVSLEVTAEETFPGAWSMRKGFNFELPEGVYVTEVEVTDTENFVKTTGGTKADATTTDWENAFFDAYQDGDHVNFEFEKRVFDDVNVDLEDDPATVTFKLTLVADPTFEGDVVLKFVGDLVDEQEVTIAKFVKPYTTKAEQNDLKIDYRYTEVPTAITITEAEDGLWAKGASFEFNIEKGDLLQFEDDATFEVDADSDLEIKDNTKDGTLSFSVKSESDEAATVTIKDIELFMQRNIPAGAYDLSITSSLARAYEAQKLYAPDEANCTASNHDDDKDCYVGDVCDYDDTVKEAFVNVVTAGRDQDDNSFTTKVVVPVGESYLIAGEKQVTLDVPAYINAAGYTMLPVRAVATALGINNDNVLWDQATKTVTILYGQRIITMVAGQKTVYVNGSAIPASAAVEIVDGRTFLPMRDLATALGVTDITWDASTRTATLNGNQK